MLAIVRFILEWGYYVFFETTASGRSPGKRALSLRVVKEGGYPIGFIDSVLRNLLRGADFLPVGYVVGLFAMAGDARFRRLGDRVAGTHGRRRGAQPGGRAADAHAAADGRRAGGFPAAPAAVRRGSARRWSSTSGAST